MFGMVVCWALSLQWMHRWAGNVVYVTGRIFEVKTFRSPLCATIPPV